MSDLAGLPNKVKQVADDDLATVIAQRDDLRAELHDAKMTLEMLDGKRAQESTWLAVIEDLKRECADLRAAAVQAREALKAAEWIKVTSPDGTRWVKFCPSCNESFLEGHNLGCPRQLALAALDAALKEAK